MHVAHLEEIAEWLEAGAPHKANVEGFDIFVGVYAISKNRNYCGTICCIAGAATQFFNDKEGILRQQARSNACREADWSDVFDEAQKILDLDRDQAHQLFEPNGGYDLSDYNDPARAARVIRNFIATGVVNWKIK